MIQENEIRWSIGDQEDDAGDGHVTFHYAYGVDQAGNRYIGTAVLCDGELDEVTDIEKE